MGDVRFFIIGVAAGFWSAFKDVKRGLKQLEKGREDNKGNED